MSGWIRLWIALAILAMPVVFWQMHDDFPEEWKIREEQLSLNQGTLTFLDPKAILEACKKRDPNITGYFAKCLEDSKYSEAKDLYREEKVRVAKVVDQYVDESLFRTQAIFVAKAAALWALVCVALLVLLAASKWILSGFQQDK